MPNSNDTNETTNIFNTSWNYLKSNPGEAFIYGILLIIFLWFMKKIIWNLLGIDK